MGELEDTQGGADVLGVDFPARGQRRGDGGGFVAELGLFRRQRRLVDRSGEVRGQEPFLHCFDFSGPLLERESLLALDLARVLERGLQCTIEPVGQFTIRDADGFKIGDDRVFEIITAPAHARMVFRRVVVGAPIVIVRSHSAPLQLPFDPFSGDQRTAVLAGEKPACQRHVDLRRRSPNLAVEQVLALRERSAVDQRTMLAGEVPLAPLDLADVDAVPQHAGERRPMESRVARLVSVPLSGELVGQGFKRVPSAGIQLEGSHHGLRVLRMRTDRLFPFVRAVHVAIRRQPVLPSLATAFLDALQHLGSQVVAVVLSDGSHHVERQRSGWSGSELVVDERERDAMLVFEFLHANSVSHVAADAIELVTQNRPQILTFCVRFHPCDHLIEGHSRRSALGRLCHFELANDRPSALGRTFARGP